MERMVYTIMLYIYISISAWYEIVSIHSSIPFTLLGVAFPLRSPLLPGHSGCSRWVPTWMGTYGKLLTSTIWETNIKMIVVLVCPCYIYLYIWPRHLAVSLSEDQPLGWKHAELDQLREFLVRARDDGLWVPQEGLPL